MTLSIAVADSRASAGAEFLDIKQPGWESKITLETLDIERSTCCVLGQVYGSYWVGTRDLGLDDVDDRVKLGYTVEEDERVGTALLNDAWKRLIRSRRQQRRG